MSYTIHLDQAATQELIYNIRAKADLLYEIANDLYKTTLLVDWQSPSREDYFYELYKIIRQILILCDQLDALAFKAAKEMDQWIMQATHFSYFRL